LYSSNIAKSIGSNKFQNSIFSDADRACVSCAGGIRICAISGVIDSQGLYRSYLWQIKLPE
jgi:hypothetical protein